MDTNSLSWLDHLKRGLPDIAATMGIPYSLAIKATDALYNKYSKKRTHLDAPVPPQQWWIDFRECCLSIDPNACQIAPLLAYDQSPIVLTQYKSHQPSPYQSLAQRDPELFQHLKHIMSKFDFSTNQKTTYLHYLQTASKSFPEQSSDHRAQDFRSIETANARAIAGLIITAIETADPALSRSLFSPTLSLLGPLSKEVFTKFDYLITHPKQKTDKIDALQLRSRLIYLWNEAEQQIVNIYRNLNQLPPEQINVITTCLSLLIMLARLHPLETKNFWPNTKQTFQKEGLLHNPYLARQIATIGSYSLSPDSQDQFLLNSNNQPSELVVLFHFLDGGTQSHSKLPHKEILAGQVTDPHSLTHFTKKQLYDKAIEYTCTQLKNPSNIYAKPGLSHMVINWPYQAIQLAEKHDALIHGEKLDNLETCLREAHHAFREVPSSLYKKLLDLLNKTPRNYKPKK